MSKIKRIGNYLIIPVEVLNTLKLRAPDPEPVDWEKERTLYALECKTCGCTATSTDPEINLCPKCDTNTLLPVGFVMDSEVLDTLKLRASDPDPIDWDKEMEEYRNKTGLRYVSPEVGFVDQDEEYL
jgi:hypothetical protein